MKPYTIVILCVLVLVSCFSVATIGALIDENRLLNTRLSLIYRIKTNDLDNKTIDTQIGDTIVFSFGGTSTFSGEIIKQTIDKKFVQIKPDNEERPFWIQLSILKQVDISTKRSK